MHVRPRSAWVFLAALFLALASGCGGDAPAPATSKDSAPAEQRAPAIETPSVPAIAFEQRVIDLGDVFDAADQVVSFAFTSAGGAELVIEDIKTTCGCTTTELTQTRFAPGEGDAIEVRYKPVGSGKIRRTVFVHSNDAAQPAIELHIDAVVKPFVEFEPAQVLLGERDRGVEHRVTARFRCADPNALVLEISSMHPELSVQIVGQGDDGWQELELVVSPAVPWGSFVGRVLVRVQGVATEGAAPVVHVARLLLQAMMYDELRVEPLYLSVGFAPVGGSLSASSQVRSRHGEPFSIASLTFEDAVPSGLTARSEPLEAPHIGHRVIIEGASGDHSGPVSGALLVETDLEGEPVLRLQLIGRVGEVQPPKPTAPGAHNH